MKLPLLELQSLDGEGEPTKKFGGIRVTALPPDQLNGQRFIWTKERKNSLRQHIWLKSDLTYYDYIESSVYTPDVSVTTSFISKVYMFPACRPAAD